MTLGIEIGEREDRDINVLREEKFRADELQRKWKLFKFDLSFKNFVMEPLI